jgi:hypothetical protein
MGLSDRLLRACNTSTDRIHAFASDCWIALKVEKRLTEVGGADSPASDRSPMLVLGIGVEEFAKAFERASGDGLQSVNVKQLKI